MQVESAMEPAEAMESAKVAEEIAAGQQDRRAVPRHGVDEDARLLLVEHGSTIACRIVNLGLNGCRVRTQERFCAGTRVNVELSFRVRGLAFRFSGVTQWTDGRHLAGIRFVNVASRRRNELVEALSEVKEENARRADELAAEELAAARLEAEEKAAAPETAETLAVEQAGQVKKRVERAEQSVEEAGKLAGRAAQPVEQVTQQAEQAEKQIGRAVQPAEVEPIEQVGKQAKPETPRQSSVQASVQSPIQFPAQAPVLASVQTTVQTSTHAQARTMTAQTPPQERSLFVLPSASGLQPAPEPERVVSGVSGRADGFGLAGQRLPEQRLAAVPPSGSPQPPARREAETYPAALPPRRPAGRERREQSREEVDTSAVIYLIKIASKLSGRILDLSLSGCCIRTDERFPVGIYTRVETEFRIEGLPFRLGGVIQSIHDRHHVGIRFLDVSDRKREQVEQLIEEIRELRERGMGKR